MYQSNRRLNISPHPGHLTPFPARGGGNLIARLDFTLSVPLIPRGLINHGGDKLSGIQRKRLWIRSRLVEN